MQRTMFVYHPLFLKFVKALKEGCSKNQASFVTLCFLIRVEFIIEEVDELSLSSNTYIREKFFFKKIK